LVRVLKALLVIALVAVVVMGLAATVGCDGADGNGDVPNGNPNGEVPNGETPNGDEPNGDEPVEPTEPDLTSGLGWVIDCDEYDGPGFQDGDPAPDFSFEDATGTTFALSDFQGRSVMLNFWRTTCNPCAIEMPHLQEVYNEWQGGEVVMLIINIGEDADTVNEFLNDLDLSLPVILDREAEVAEQYRAFTIPCTFFIDKAGGIRGVVFGAFQSPEQLENLLNQLITL
jgi:peroxiredoxin